MSPTSYLAAPPRGAWTKQSSTATPGFNPPGAAPSAVRCGRRRPPVVVEIGENRGLLAQVGDPRSPLAQLALGVVPAPPARAVVEADQGPARGERGVGQRAARVAADRERDAERVQQAVDLGREPARVAELEAVASGREPLERVRQPVVVAAEALRQLPQDRPELRRLDERSDTRVEPLDAPLHVSQPLHVREVAARLDGEEKVLRRVRHPAGDGVRFREPVERRVDFDRVEQRRVVREPAPGRAAGRVDTAAPVRVVPARATDPHGLVRHITPP